MFALAAAVATLGLIAHNTMSLPLPLYAPETSLPFAIYVALFVWYTLTRSRAARLAMLMWALINLVVGSILTVLPLPFLPFVPEQSVAHYVAHVIYGLTQVPLIALLLWRDASERVRQST